MMSDSSRASRIAEAICRIAEGDLDDDEAVVRSAYPGLATEIMKTYRLAVPRESSGNWVPPQTGEDFDGYRIHGILGEGGNAVILRAERDGRRVALKVLPPSGTDAKMRLARFKREVTLLQTLDHPDIVKIEEMRLCKGMPYGVMEFVEGCSLDQLLFALRAGYPAEIVGGRLVGFGSEKLGPDARPVQSSRAYIGAIVRLGVRLARVLEYAHEKGVVHRDIKPGNVMIRSDGRPALLDFGLAWEFSSPRLTQTGDVVGTPAYMSPEQASADQNGVGALSDLYGLTAVLYECLTLKIPFQADNWWEVVRKVLAETPPAPRELNPELPAALEALLLRGMAKLSEQRFHSAGEMARALEALYVNLRDGGLFESTGSGERPKYQPQALEPPSSRLIVVPAGKRAPRRWWRALPVLLLLLAVGIATWAVLSRDPRLAAIRQLRADPPFPRALLAELPPAEAPAFRAYLALLLEQPVPEEHAGDPIAEAAFLVSRQRADAREELPWIPDDPLADRVRVLLYTDAGADSLAWVYCQRRLDQEGRRPDLLVLAAELRPTERDALLREALERAPEGLLAHWKRGQWLVERGDIGTGRPLLEAARARVDKAPASLERALARAWLRSGKAREGLELLDGIDQLGDGELFLLRGEGHLQLGELVEARRDFRAAASSPAHRHLAWLGLAAIHVEEGKRSAARKILAELSAPEDAFWREVYQRLERAVGE